VTQLEIKRAAYFEVQGNVDAHILALIYDYYKNHMYNHDSFIVQ